MGTPLKPPMKSCWYCGLETETPCTAYLDATLCTDYRLGRRLLSAPTPKKIDAALDVQIGGDHYKTKTIQPIEYILANKLGFCEGNIVKYITRWQDKGGRQDLEKIKHYVDFLLAELDKQNGAS